MSTIENARPQQMTIDTLRSYWTRLCELERLYGSHNHREFETCDICRENGMYDAARRRYELAAVDYVDQLMLANPLNFVDQLADTLINVSQLLDGWHADGTAWSEWDESVRSEVRARLAECEQIRERTKAGAA
jgi:hypothetical protein